MIFTIQANHQACVLTRTAALFSRFGLNINDWHMSANTQHLTMSQQIHVHCEIETAKRIQKQLQRMVDVHQVEWHIPSTQQQKSSNINH